MLGALIGGIFARKAEKRARAQAMSDALNRGVYAREAAERSGFNPLTMLGAGGGYVEPTGPALSSSQFFADAATGLIDGWFNRVPAQDAQVEQARQRDATAQQLSKQSWQTPAATFGYDLTKVQPPVDVVTSHRADMSPRANPLYDHNREQVILLRPNGDAIVVDKTTADGYGWPNLYKMSSGDDQEMFGEIFGEISSVAQVAFDPTFNGGVKPLSFRLGGVKSQTLLSPKLGGKSVKTKPGQRQFMGWD